MEIKGTVKALIAPVQVSEKLKKAQLIVDYAENPQYNQVISFEAVNDKCAILDNLNIGDEVEVSFNLNGREWVDKTGVTKYFNTLQVWKVSVLSSTADNGSDLSF